MITFNVELEREDDGRWLAEVVELPGVLAYGKDAAGYPLTIAASPAPLLAGRFHPLKLVRRSPTLITLLAVCGSASCSYGPHQGGTDGG